MTLPLVYGQNDAGRIVGTVTDASGAGVPNASITVVNERTGQERKVNGDAAGSYVVPYLASSSYKVTVQQSGFAQWQTTGIPLSVGQERTVNIVLQPASVTTEVTVSGGELTQVDTSSAAIGANVNAREVATLAAERPAAFAALSAGAGRADGRRRQLRQHPLQRTGQPGKRGAFRRHRGQLHHRRLARQSERRNLHRLPPAEQPGDRLRVPRGFEQLSGRVSAPVPPARSAWSASPAATTSRRRVRISSQQRAGRAQFLRRRQQDAAAVEPIRRLDRRSHQEGQAVLLRRAGIFAAARRREPDRHGSERVGARARGGLHPAPAGRLSHRNAHQQPRSGPGAARRVLRRSTNISAASAWTITSTTSSPSTSATTATRAT